MFQDKIIGIDLGATNIRAGLVCGEKILNLETKKIVQDGTVESVLQDFYLLIDSLISKDVKAIGIGVPSVVDSELGIVYDTQYIPAWKEVPLKTILESKYQIPVIINNDANCFALGELYFGKGKGKENLIGLTIGTGLGAGIIIRGKLFSGANNGAGEFGMLDYLDQNFDYYAAGQFFSNKYQLSGETVFQMAQSSDIQALEIYNAFGINLGNAIKQILYTYDIPDFVLGGSVKQAFPYFKTSMWNTIQTFAYGNSLKQLKIESSEIEHAAVLGAAALYLDTMKDK